MNAKRRKELEKVIALIEEARNQLETLKDEEQEAFDNMPEGLQYSEKGERMETAISFMDDSFNELESAIENINSAIE
jgi:prefoldin subunit 5